MNTTNSARPNEQVPSTSLYPDKAGFVPSAPVAVGDVILASEPIEYNTGRKTATLTVVNRGDRPIQVGSHFHFFEVNRYLEFDRNAAFGCHLNIPATTAIRFEPGDSKQVEVVTFAGKRRVIGFNGLVMGYTGEEDAPTYFPARMRALRRMHGAGFMCTGGKDDNCRCSASKPETHAAASEQHSPASKPHGSKDAAPEKSAAGRETSAANSNNDKK